MHSRPLNATAVGQQRPPAPSPRRSCSWVARDGSINSTAAPRTKQPRFHVDNPLDGYRKRTRLSGLAGAVRDDYDDSGMAQNFIPCDREQVMLLPPSLTDWLPEDHLVWTVLGGVEQMDLEGFYGAYRANGQGRAAYDPAMMVALLLYSYAIGLRSSRQIERA